MSSESKTPNIGLSQWQNHEYVKREDFVNDNLIVDREIKGLQDEKVDKISGKGLSTNDYTNEEKNKLAELEQEIREPKYTPEIHYFDNIITTGQSGFDESRKSTGSYADSVVNGQVSVGLKGRTMYNVNYNGVNYSDWSLVNGTDVNIENIYIEFIGTGSTATVINKVLLKSSTQYTIVLNILDYEPQNKYDIGIRGVKNQEAYFYPTNPLNLGINKILVKTENNILHNFGLYKNNTLTTGENPKISILAILEGDYTADNSVNKPLAYGVNSTVLAQRIKSTGKNQFNIENIERQSDRWSNWIDISVFDEITVSRNGIGSETIKIGQYTESLDYVSEFTFQTGSYTFTKSNNATKVKVQFLDNYNWTLEKIQNANIQLEKGTTATPYEQYKEDKTYILSENANGDIEELRSLPNGVKDEVRNGNLHKRTNKTSLQSSDFIAITSGTNNQWVRFKVPSDSISYGIVGENLVTSYYVEVFTSINGTIPADNVERYTLIASTISQYNLVFPLETFTDLEDARNKLAETPLIYQLAESKITELSNMQPLYAYKNGTIQFENIIQETSIYNDVESCIITHRNYPIKNIDFIKNVDKETGKETSLDVSKAEFVLEDGIKIGFTHPDLSDNDLVKWDYYYENESTNAEKVISYPINTKALIDSNAKSATKNSNSIETLNNQVSNLMTDLNSQKLPSIEGQASIIDMPIGSKYGKFNKLNTKGQTLVNLVKNGNFSNGTSGWLNQYGSFSVANQILNSVASASNNKSNVVQRYIPCNTSDKFFIYFKAKVTNDIATDMYILGHSNGYDYTPSGNRIIHNPKNNVWYELSGIFTAEGASSTLVIYCFHTYENASSADGNIMQVDGNAGVFAINMTQLGIEDYTEEQMLNLVRNDYFEGMQSVVNPTFKTEGVNICDGIYFADKTIKTVNLPHTHITTDENRTVLKLAIHTNDTIILPFKFSPNTQYAFNVDIKNGVTTAWSSQLIIQYNDGSTYKLGCHYSVADYQTITYTSEVGKSIDYLYVFSTNGTKYPSYIDIDTFQIIKGITLLPNEPYQFIQASIKMADGTDCIARSLPNGVRDEINILSQKMIRNVGEYILKSSDITHIATSYANLDYAIISKPLDYIDASYDTSNFESILHDKYGAKHTTDYNNIDNIGFFNLPFSQKSFAIGYPKETSLAEAQLDLAGTKLQYQLAVTIIEDIQVNGSLTSFAGGRLLQWNGYNQAHTADSDGRITLNYPVQEIDEIFYFDNEGDKVIETSYALENDGLSITGLTANTSYHVEGKAKNQIMAEISGKTVGNKKKQIDSNTTGIKTNSSKIADISEDIALLIVLNS